MARPAEPLRVGSDAARESVALVRVAGIEALLEPSLALFGGTVGPGVLIDSPPGLLLQTVVSDRCRRGQRLFEVAGVEDASLGR